MSRFIKLIYKAKPLTCFIFNYRIGLTLLERGLLHLLIECGIFNLIMSNKKFHATINGSA